MAKVLLLPGARPANEGEALVVNDLKERLPGAYTLIPNVEITERGRPAFEYDLIIIGPHAVPTQKVWDWCRENLGPSVQALRRRAFPTTEKVEQKWDQAWTPV